jgi:hypothetical protein
MRLNVHIESGSLGHVAGDCVTTIDPPNTVNILVDLARLPNPNGLRDLIMRELDLALMCLVYGLTPEQVRAKAEELDRKHPI